MRYSQDPYPWVGDRQMGRLLQLQRFSPGSKGFESHVRFPSPGILHWEDKPPKCLALKASGAYFQESQKAVGNRDSTLKGHTQNLTHSKTQSRSSNLKGGGVRPTCWSCRVSQRGNRQLELLLVAAILGRSVRPGGHRCWQVPFWNPPSSLPKLGPSPTHQPVSASTGTPQATRLA